MIRWSSAVRVKESGRLGFVCDLDEGACGDTPDPSCVRIVELVSAGAPRDEWNRIECFLGDLDEVVEAEGGERDLSCSDFEYMKIESYWTEETPPDQRHSVWVAAEEEGAAAWVERGDGLVEHAGHMAPPEVEELREALAGSGISRWKHHYKREGWGIGGNAWGITLIRGEQEGDR